MSRDPSEAYFESYTPIQAHKHALLEHYLGAWYPKLASWSGHVLYLETHAGRGIHNTGQLGSPLVAIRTLMNHSQRDAIVRRAQIYFYLMENDPANVSVLNAQVEKEPKIPEVIINVVECDFATKFKQELDRMEATGKRLVPAFVFMDPFGYKIPMDLVRRVLKFPNCEVMVNFMAQPVARAVRDASKVSNLDVLYGSDVWRQALGVESFESQMQKVTDLYVSAVASKWTTKLRLTGQTDYTLLHFTNHDEGRATMKRSVWAITGKFGNPGVNQLLLRDNPDQGTLIALEPDLGPLSEALTRDFWGKSFTYNEALKWLLPLDYTTTHLHQVLTEGRRNKWLTTEHKKVFGPNIGETPMKIEGSSLL